MKAFMEVVALIVRLCASVMFLFALWGNITGRLSDTAATLSIVCAIFIYVQVSVEERRAL